VVVVTQQLSLFDEDLLSCSSGEARGEGNKGHQAATASERAKPIMSDLMEQVVSRENAIRAWKRVRANKGSPGSDGMTVDDLTGYLWEYWPRIRAELLRGDYCLQPVKEVLIPKPGGGTRRFGIPTVMDRFIQQTILPVLDPIFDPTFSVHSYGFRPHHRAHQAVTQAKRYVAEGYEWVVDMELERKGHRFCRYADDQNTYVKSKRVG
jgi:RNA-directed DNA polymerase